MKPFHELAAQTNRFAGHVIAFDPGETTGWAWFHDYQLVDCGQFQTGNVYGAYTAFLSLFESIHHQGFDLDTGNVRCVIEDYRIYRHKLEDHTFSSVYTIKVVGMAELVCVQNNIPYKLTLAQHAKKFSTDKKLEAWNYWQTGQRHARDAIRHATFYIMCHGLDGKPISGSGSGMRNAQTKK